MKGIITCAGYATRLWPITKNLPKPLLEIKDEPIVQHLIDKLLELPDLDEVFIITNKKFYPSFESWLNGVRFDVPVKVISDGTSSNDERIGQIGDVLFVMDKENINSDLVILAGDNLFNFSLLDTYKKFKENRFVVNPLYDVGSMSAAKHLGTVLMDDKNRFTEFHEKAEMPKSTLASLGIYFFPKEKLNLIRDYLSSGANPDKMGYFLTWLMRHDTILGHVYYEKWFDIGRIESLEQARRDFHPAQRLPSK